MFASRPYCESPETVKRETLLYNEYYLGEKDDQHRRHGVGRHCWTGPESIEWHSGNFVRDAMHGSGEYRARYRLRPGLFLSYEGRLYVNNLHGYGVMSYPDGSVFTGLFKNNFRYGPGIETFADVRANVGLWRGTQLIRLAWKPLPSVAPDLQAWPGGRALVDPHRKVLGTDFKQINKVNQAIAFLKQNGADPVFATENWSRLYPKHCTDVGSQLCHVELFDYEYYDGKIYSLKQLDGGETIHEELEKESQNSLEFTGPYYAWNNDAVTIDIMKHCFTHEKQREEVQVDLMGVLSGARSLYKPPAWHELYCRTLLMTCYLGHVANTAYLINENGVDPNISDMVGNTAVMYATCGDQGTLINFLVEAGADMNCANDSCCTPLAVALMRYLCAKREIPANAMCQALIPPPLVPAVPSTQLTVVDWNITRELVTPEATKHTLGKASSKIGKLNKQTKSLTSVLPTPSKRAMETLQTIDEDDPETRLYKEVNTEYMIKVTDLFDIIPQPVPYLFELTNMVEELMQLQAKQPDKKDLKQTHSKVLKEPTKPSKEVIWQSGQKEDEASLTNSEMRKAEVWDRIKLTIVQLLENGAKPNLVRCPQPALVMAVVAECPDLVVHLVKAGADVNEVYPQHLYYTPLHIAVSKPLTQSTLDLVQILLTCGARTDGRLRYCPEQTVIVADEIEEPGPTLLHYMLARRVDTEAEEDIRRQIMHLLLEHNCDPLERYQGQSALAEATKRLDLLDIIINNPKTNLNGAIDDSRQTLLVKMFHMPYFKTMDNVHRNLLLTNLLLFGADPLIECEFEGEKYENLFVLVKKILFGLTINPSQASSHLKVQKENVKGKKPDPKKEKESAASDILADFKQALELMTECSRILYTRWLQTQLAKELIQIIDRFKHRHWSMIIKEYKLKKAAGLWLTAQRSFEIWSHLITTRKKVYTNNEVLWKLLCISHFFHLRSVTKYGFNKVTTPERNESESYARYVLKENKKSVDIVPMERYVRPELFVGADSKFDVCFECFLPLTEERVLCERCKYVSFCNMECLVESIEKSNGHACNDYLILKYLPTEPERGCHYVVPPPRYKYIPGLPDVEAIQWLPRIDP